MTNSIVTFNSIYNVVRGEKKNESLQKLPTNFYIAINKYLTDKKKELEKYKKEGDKKRFFKEKKIYENSKKLISELLEIRLFKISKIGIVNSLQGNKILSEIEVNETEKEFLENIKKLADKIKNEL